MQLLDKIHTVFTAALKPSEHPPNPEGTLSKHLVDGNLGCKSGSQMIVVVLGQHYNTGEKPTVILYTYTTNRHVGTPKQSLKHTTRNLDITRLCYIGLRIGFRVL